MLRERRVADDDAVAGRAAVVVVRRDREQLDRALAAAAGKLGAGLAVARQLAPPPPPIPREPQAIA